LVSFVFSFLPRFDAKLLEEELDLVAALNVVYKNNRLALDEF